MCRQVSGELPSIKFHEYSFSGFCVVTREQMDEQTDMVKLMGAFLQLFV
jgi:hypothetical protein